MRSEPALPRAPVETTSPRGYSTGGRGPILHILHWLYLGYFSVAVLCILWERFIDLDLLRQALGFGLILGVVWEPKGRQPHEGQCGWWIRLFCLWGGCWFCLCPTCFPSTSQSRFIWFPLCGQYLSMALAGGIGGWRSPRSQAWQSRETALLVLTLPRWGGPSPGGRRALFRKQGSLQAAG